MADTDHKNYYNKVTLKELFEGFGIEVVSTFYFPIPFEFFGDRVKQNCLYAIFKVKS